MNNSDGEYKTIKTSKVRKIHIYIMDIGIILFKLTVKDIVRIIQLYNPIQLTQEVTESYNKALNTITITYHIMKE